MKSKKYEFLKIIGRGAYGSVYHAKRLSDNMDVAIKEIKFDNE